MPAIITGTISTKKWGGVDRRLGGLHWWKSWEKRVPSGPYGRCACGSWSRAGADCSCLEPMAWIYVIGGLEAHEQVVPPCEEETRPVREVFPDVFRWELCWLMMDRLQVGRYAGYQLGCKWKPNSVVLLIPNDTHSRYGRVEFWASLLLNLASSLYVMAYDRRGANEPSSPLWPRPWWCCSIRIEDSTWKSSQ